MAIPVLSSDFWDVRTDAIIRNLQDDEMLAEGLDDSAVGIYKGFPRLDVDKFAIFVYRSSSDEDEYSMGGDKVMITATWSVVCLTRHAGDPAELEKYVSYFGANVLRNLLRHKQDHDEDGYCLWSTGTPQASSAAEVRTEEDQAYDIEAIPYTLMFELILTGM